jgi:hypothetical protein
MIDLHEQIFDETYEIILKALKARSQNPDFSCEKTKMELESFYKYEGLDWTGRGDIKQAEIEGTILAYESFIMRLERGEDVS